MADSTSWGSAWLSRNYNVRLKGNQKPSAEKAKSKEAAEQAFDFGFYLAGRKRKFLSQSTNKNVWVQRRSPNKQRNHTFQLTCLSPHLIQ